MAINLSLSSSVLNLFHAARSSGVRIGATSLIHLTNAVFGSGLIFRGFSSGLGLTFCDSTGREAMVRKQRTTTNRVKNGKVSMAHILSDQVVEERKQRLSRGRVAAEVK